MRSVYRKAGSPSRTRTGAGWVWLSLILGFPLVVSLVGCRSTPAASAPVDARHSASRAGRDDHLRRSAEARRRAVRGEKAGHASCVDDYYRAAVFAYAALVDPADDRACGHAVDLHNENLADCLRAAHVHGRIDPRSRLLINAPGGAISAAVAKRGFPWSDGDFHRLLDAKDAPDKPIRIHPKEGRRDGLGSPQVVVRCNPGAEPSDQFMPKTSFFAATAVLRPDLGAWLGAGTGTGTDVLELHDPLRVRAVDVAGRRRAIAADIDAPNDIAEQAVDSRRFTLTGFVNPSQELANAQFGFIEPYQPGKVVVVLIHGLLDNPYTFKAIVNRLREDPGIVDRYQFAFFRYPTGNSFLRSAAILRGRLRAAEATFDPGRSDPGFQNMVVVGYSMGGLLAKLQIARSGGEVWSLFSDRPLDSLVMPEETRSLLRDMAYFEPLPFIRRTVFLATPHEGSGYATNIVGRIATSLVERPQDATAMVAQIERDNPGAISAFASDLPTSIDLLAVQNPLLDVMSRLPLNPATTYHVIAGTSYAPPSLARGDGVVPISSARIPGAASERLVPAVHTNITRSPEATREFHRILRQHLAELPPPAPAGP